MAMEIEISAGHQLLFWPFLLVVASASLIWAIWKDAFEPKDFLVYFLIYGWGYILLLKSDTEYRCKRLEKRMTEVLARLETLETSMKRGRRILPSGELLPVLLVFPGFSRRRFRGESGGESGGEAGGTGAAGKRRLG